VNEHKFRSASLIADIRLGLSLMTRHERRTAVLLMLTALFDGLLQTVTIMAIVPLVQLMIDPAAAPSGWLLSKLSQMFGAHDQKIFLVTLAGCLAALVVFKGVFSWLQTGWMSRFSAGCEVRLSAFLMQRILKAPYVWLVRQNSARLRQLLFGYVSVWSRDFMRSMMKLLNDLAFVVFIVAVLVWSHPMSGLIVAGVASLLGSAIFTLVRPRLRRYAEAKRRGIVGATQVSTEAVLGFKEVKMAGAEDRFTRLFDDQVRIYSGSDAKAQQWAQLPRYVLEVIAYGTLIGLSISVVLSDQRNPETAGLVLLYGFAAARLLPVFSMVISGLSTLIGSFPLIVELEQLIEATEAPEIQVGSQLLDLPWREFRLDKVSLQYQAGRDAVEGVSLSIIPGRSYGVVGPSGAGKSTVIDLIAGLLEPSSGSAMLNGKPLTAAQQVAWRRHFGYVAQRPFLQDASLRDNIIFNSGATVDEDRLQHSIVLARLEKVVARLQGGLDGPLGEQGAFLSGGERQRVAIARALYRGADLLILDEATSSLDTLVEQEITESLATLHGQVTTIIVSHRMGLVRDCDEIWLFDNASLSAHGTHEQLFASSDLYRRMVAQPQEKVASNTHEPD
jgi:ABC-type multidrug transport system fused ATPase/permease subunit